MASSNLPKPLKPRTGELSSRVSSRLSVGVLIYSPVSVSTTPFIADWGSESVFECVFEPKGKGVRNRLRERRMDASRAREGVSSCEMSCKSFIPESLELKVFLYAPNKYHTDG